MSAIEPLRNAADDASRDRIVRGTAADGLVRALAINGTDTVRVAQERLGLAAVSTVAVGRLLMAAQMIGSLFKDDGEAITLSLRCEGPIGGLTAEADGFGHGRGFAENAALALDAADMRSAVPAAIGGGLLVVMRTSPLIEPHVSQVGLVDGSISNDLMAYYMLSEQIPTIIELDVALGEDGTVANAAGYFIQLMPGADGAVLAQLQEALASARSLPAFLEEGVCPGRMLEELLGPLGYKAYEEMPAEFRCSCSHEQCERTLLSLGANELAAMVDEGEPIDITCDYCHERYTFTPEELAALLQQL